MHPVIGKLGLQRESIGAMPDRPPPRSAVNAVIRARRLLLALADRLIPAEYALFNQTIGVGRTHVIGTIAELGVADLLAEKPQTAAEMAPKLGVDEDALHRVLRASALEGLLKMDRAGRFKLTRLGRPLRSDIPDSLRDWARYIALPSTTHAWADLTESVRTGRSAFRRVHGTSIWEWYATHPDEERMFAGAMRRITEQLAPAIVAGYEWPRDAVVCDVAGGVGTLVAALLRERDDLRAVLVDAPGVLAEAEPWLAAQGLRERVELKPGDMFEGVDARADVYLLKDILHDWDDEASAKILANVRATMPPGSRLLVIEALQERNRPDQFASLTDIQMLTQCEEGRQRSADELAGLFRGAGLRPGAVKLTSGPALVEALA
jgi:hypothetical protein